MKAEWMFDETVAVGVDYTDADLVAKYDEEHSKFRDFEKEAEGIADKLELSNESVILDIGCGTGGITLPLARTCKSVYAVDASPAMIGRLKHKTQQAGIENIALIQAGFLTYEHEGEPLDAIVSTIALHHIPDFWKQIALCRLCEMLKPGGRFFLLDVVFDFEPKNYETDINDWLEAGHGNSSESMAHEKIVHIRDEYSTWDWMMSGMLERAGFTIDHTDEIMPSIVAFVCSKS